MSQTILTQVKIDVSPNGVVFIMEGLDNNVAQLILSASTFTVQPLDTQTVDTSNVTIKSDKMIQFVPRV